MNDNNRNMILAVVLSMFVLFGWQFFIAGPQLEQAQRRGGNGPAGTGRTGMLPTLPRPRQPMASVAAHATTPRPSPIATRRVAPGPALPIDTESVAGSINLAGARIDDLRLNKYHETSDPEQPHHHAALAGRLA